MEPHGKELSEGLSLCADDTEINFFAWDGVKLVWQQPGEE